MLNRVRNNWKTMMFMGWIAIFFGGCTISETNKNNANKFRVVIREASEPDALHPLNSRSNIAKNLLPLLYQKLLAVDMRTSELTAVLAEHIPEVEEINDTTLHIAYTLRSTATWDNGTPILAEDVVFSFKAAILPIPENGFNRALLSHILEVYPDSVNSRIVHFICRKHIKSLYGTGAEAFILPEYFYDPGKSLQNHSFSSLRNAEPDLLNNDSIMNFVREFNSVERGYSNQMISGSGAYTLLDWQPGQRVVFKRKDTWWGFELFRLNNYFEAYPHEIEYAIISDDATALSALKNNYLDVLQGLNTIDFADLNNSATFREKFIRTTAPWLVMNGIAVNCCKPQLTDSLTRLALSHLVNREQFIRQVLLDMGSPVCSFLHPDISPYYKCDKSFNTFDPDEAARLLGMAGWQDENGDGVLDKTVDGERQSLNLTYLYNEGNEGRKTLGLLLKEYCRKSGINIILDGVIWNTYLEKLFAGDFDLAFVSIEDEFGAPDPSLLFNSKSGYAQGNIACYKDPVADSLSKEIAITLDPIKSRELWTSLQFHIQRDMPYIFVSTNTNKLIFSKRLRNNYSSAVDPGYWAAGFKLQPESK